MIPLGEGNPAPPEGVGSAVLDSVAQGLQVRLSIFAGLSLSSTRSGPRSMLPPPKYPPRGPAHSAGPTKKVCTVGPFLHSKFGSFFDFDFGRFRGRLGSLLGGHFGPLGPPSSLKMPSRGRSKAYLCQKRRFCSHTTFSNTKTAFWTPRRRPKRPKIGPRRLQDGLEEALFRS